MSFLDSRHPTAHGRRSADHLRRHGRDAERRTKAKRDGRGGTRAGLRDDARATERSVGPRSFQVHELTNAAHLPLHVLFACSWSTPL